jgi:hypothetical protein
VITQPTAARILEVVQQDLAEQVLPHVRDPQALASLHMVQHILGTLARRAEHEIAWMVEESEAMAALGRRVGAEAGEPAPVQAALDELAAADGSSLHLADVAARYSLAGEVLSCALEAVPADGSELRAAVEAVLDLRLAHEVEIMGDFQLVGRT